jgi:hypothetical protein
MSPGTPIVENVVAIGIDGNSTSGRFTSWQKYTKSGNLEIDNLNPVGDNGFIFEGIGQFGLAIRYFLNVIFYLYKRKGTFSGPFSITI